MWHAALPVALLLVASYHAPVVQAQACPQYLSNYTSSVSNLSIYTSFLETYESVGLDTSPSDGFGAFIPTNAAWRRIEQILATSVGGGANSTVTDQEADVLLTIGLYHLTAEPGNRTDYLNAGSALTALGTITGYNVSLYFEKFDGQIQVEGIPFGNAAPLPLPRIVCGATTVYIIDEVMQPSTSLSGIPGFSEILAAIAQGPGAAPVPVSVFDLPLPPDTPSISVIATGPGTAAGNGTIDINGDAQASPMAASPDAPAPAPVSQAALAMLTSSRWCTCLAGIIGLVVAAGASRTF